MAIDLTELEHCTLATIRQWQPCSAYEVRQVFARSSTPDWSGSAGSIYPVVERLLRRDLVQAERQVGSGRGRRNLTVTTAGEQVVLGWITNLEPSTAKATPDPIRTRVSFMDQLVSDQDRAEFFKRAETLTEEMLGALRSAAAAEGASRNGEYLAALGAIHQLEARRNWLREVGALF